MILLLASSGTLSIGLLFWLLMIIWLIFGAITGWPRVAVDSGWRPIGGHLLLWFLLFLIGWQVFGFPIAK